MRRELKMKAEEVLKKISLCRKSFDFVFSFVNGKHSEIQRRKNAVSYDTVTRFYHATIDIVRYLCIFFQHTLQRAETHANQELQQSSTSLMKPCEKYFNFLNLVFQLYEYELGFEVLQPLIDKIECVQFQIKFVYLLACRNAFFAANKIRASHREDIHILKQSIEPLRMVRRCAGVVKHFVEQLAALESARKKAKDPLDKFYEVSNERLEKFVADQQRVTCVTSSPLDDEKDWHPDFIDSYTKHTKMEEKIAELQKEVDFQLMVNE